MLRRLLGLSRWLNARRFAAPLVLISAVSVIYLLLLSPATALSPHHIHTPGCRLTFFSTFASVVVALPLLPDAPALRCLSRHAQLTSSSTTHRQ
ncbi:hypothetical protein C8R43DRAFT_985118 [Mycena crocata]|nr:hypothetical protein C8R43DRAFT_985118 [Mycena crocata]